MTTPRKLREQTAAHDPPAPDLCVTILGRLRPAVSASLSQVAHILEDEARRSRQHSRTRGDVALRLERTAADLRALAHQVAP